MDDKFLVVMVGIGIVVVLFFDVVFFNFFICGYVEVIVKVNVVVKFGNSVNEVKICYESFDVDLIVFGYIEVGLVVGK